MHNQFADSGEGAAEQMNIRRTIPNYLMLALIAFTSYSRAQTISSYDALIQQGNTQLKAGNADQALSVGQSAVKIDADRWEGYTLIGGALMKLKRNEEGADALSKAIDRAPEDKQHPLRDLRRQCLASEVPLQDLARGRTYALGTGE